MEGRAAWERVIVRKGVLRACVITALAGCVGCSGHVAVTRDDQSDVSAQAPSAKCTGGERWIRIADPNDHYYLWGDNYVHGGWTDNDLIIWSLTRKGYVFESATDAWRPIARTPHPFGFDTFGFDTAAAVSSGLFFVWSELIGSAYDLGTDSWATISAMGEPLHTSMASQAVGAPDLLFYIDSWRSSAAMHHTRKMYRISTDTWHTLPTGGAPVIPAPVIAWATTALVVWGGRDASGVDTISGARFDPSTMAWTPMSTINAPTAAMPAAAVWTGRQLFVQTVEGGLYDPARDEWTPVSKLGAPTERPIMAVWTGTEVIVDGIVPGSQGIYDPRTDTWRRMMPLPESEGRPVVRWLFAAWDQCRLLARAMNGTWAYEPPPQ